MEKWVAQLRTHQANIERYENMLRTVLTDLERQFVQKRLSEERLASATPSSSPDRHRSSTGGATQGALRRPQPS
jgi:hypothetical protein